MAVNPGTSSLGFTSEPFLITPADGVDLAMTTRWVAVAVGGTLTVRTRNGQAQTLTLPAGIFPMAVTQVQATGTTATGITGFG